MNQKLYGTIEGGGSKFIFAIGNCAGEITERITVPTATPLETLRAGAVLFRARNIIALGIGCFGPLELNRGSAAYGSITSTPKAGWRNFNLLEFFRNELPGIPVVLQTDVNAALTAELLWGKVQNARHAVYVTVGTGIGAGIAIERKIHNGVSHPEAGHVSVKLHPDDIASGFEGVCPFHKGCLEGMASGPSILKRRGIDPAELNDEDSVFNLEAYYLAQLALQFFLTISPDVILFGGGVLKRAGLVEQIREQFLLQLHDYLPAENLATLIGRPHFQTDAGLYGALALALEAAEAVH